MKGKYTYSSELKENISIKFKIRKRICVKKNNNRCGASGTGSVFRTVS